MATINLEMPAGKWDLFLIQVFLCKKFWKSFYLFVNKTNKHLSSRLFNFSLKNFVFQLLKKAVIEGRGSTTILNSTVLKIVTQFTKIS